jgi:hypothetical protein
MDCDHRAFGAKFSQKNAGVLENLARICKFAKIADCTKNHTPRRLVYHLQNVVHIPGRVFDTVNYISLILGSQTLLFTGVPTLMNSSKVTLRFSVHSGVHFLTA